MDSYSIPIIVPANELQYTILIQHGLLNHFSQIISRYLPSSIMIITDENVAKYYQTQLSQQLPQARWAIIKAGETSKTFVHAIQLYQTFCNVGLDRNSLVLALGGGVVGDLAGFVSATYLRGIRLIQIPTSLLAMVDASIGGKVAVDLPQGKNLVGAFKQPEAVLIDPQFLDTLPIAEWRCGMAEVIKHGIIADPDLLSISSPNDLTLDYLARAIQVKANIVSRDPYEKNIREHLNLGHTFAHAIEQNYNYNFSHGSAVAIGLVYAAKLSWRLGFCRYSLFNQIEKTLQKLQLPTTLPAVDLILLWQAMCKDKKWKDGHSRFVLISDIGQVFIQNDIPQDLVFEVLKN